MLKALSLFSTGRAAASVLQAAGIILVARALAPGEFVVFAAIVGLLQVMQAVIDLGAGTGVSRYHKDAALVSKVLRYGREVGAIAALSSIVIMIGAAAVSRNSVIVLALPLAGWAVAERQAEVASALLVAHNRILRPVANLVARRATVVLSILILPFLTDSPSATLLLYSSASFVSSTLAAILQQHWVYSNWGSSNNVLSFSPGDVRGAPSANLTRRQVFSTLRPFWWNSVAQQVRLLDLVILGAVSGSVATAPFALASRLVAPLRLLPTTYAQLLLARLSRQDQHGDHKRYLLVPILASTVFYMALAASSPIWVPLTVGAGYTESILPLQIVLTGLVFGTVASLLTSLCQARGRATVAAAAAWIGGVLTLGLVAVLGALYGAVGAAFATILGLGLQVAILYFSLKEARKDDPLAIH